MRIPSTKSFIKDVAASGAVSGTSAPAAAAPVTEASPPALGPSQARGSSSDAALAVFRAAVDAEQVIPPARMAPRTPKDGPARPWEDARAIALPGDPAKAITVRKLEERFVFEDRPRHAGLDGVLRAWASTTHAHLWTTPLGRAMAGFGVQRYAQAAVQFDGRGKLEHVVEVLNNADRIALDQAARGHALDPEWRNHLEYGALLHDMGYMNGGIFHPKKGGNDLVYHFRARMQAEGVPDDAISDVDIEKIALVINLHGDAFPWSAIGTPQDQRRLATTRGGFGDFPYLQLNVVEEIFAQPGRTEQFVALLKQDYAEYIREKQGGMAWLDDPKQVRELIRTGYVMHAADKYKGPSDSMLAARSVGKLGAGVPLPTLAAVDGYLLEDDVRDIVRAVNSTLLSVLERLPKADVDARAAVSRMQALASQLDPTEAPRQLASSLRELAGAMRVNDKELAAKLGATLQSAARALEQLVAENAGSPSSGG